MRLLENATDGNGAAFDNPQHRNPAPDTFQSCYVYGTFGGATVKLQASPVGNGDRWFDTGVSFTEAGVQNFEVKAARFRGVVSGGTGESINMDVL
jgi:hypothetical protein